MSKQSEGLQIAWMEGRSAAEDGKPRDSCPHSDPEYAEAWASGYDSYSDDSN